MGFGRLCSGGGELKTRILVVDDDEDIRSIVGEILEDDGYEVEEAENGREALEKLTAMSQAPALVLLDMMMPEMTGAQVLLALAGNRRLAAMPVVVLSAQPVANANGARKVVRKPLSRDALLALVHEFSGRA